jgi:hypothetical protein
VSGVDLHALAARLTGDAVGSLAPVGGGGNNRLYRVVGARGEYALKRYAGDGDGARERYEREFGGLQFLWGAGIRCVPEPVALAPEAGVAIYRWIEGMPTGVPQDGDIAALAGFAARLHALRLAPGAQAMRPAREAVTSPAELGRQIERRLERLRGEAGAHPVLGGLLGEIAAEAARRSGPQPEVRSLAARWLTLSPSDFGLHNAIRTATGLVFLDFEYFGWDDPVKLVADVLWHPGMQLAQRERQKFFTLAADVYGVDPEFSKRFNRDAPLYGLRWALIVLNEFLPEVWDRRVAAGQAADRSAVLERQLAKAAGLLERVRRDAVPA